MQIVLFPAELLDRRGIGADETSMSPDAASNAAGTPPRGLEGQARETAGVTSSLLLAYVEHVGGRPAVEAVLETCGLEGAEEELRDENCWFSWETKIALFEAAAKVLDDPEFLEGMAAMALDLNVAGALKVALRTLGSPQFVYRNIVRANGRFNGSHAMEILDLGPGHARVRFAELSGNRRFHPLDCRYNRAMLPLVPRLFGLPAAHLTHPECVADGADACVYDLTWREGTALTRSGVAIGAGTGAGVLASLALAPVMLPGVVAIGLGAAGLTLRRHTRRRRDQWRHLERQAEEHAEVAQSLFASLQDLVSDLRLEEVLAKVTRNAQVAVGGREFALLVRDGDGLRCQSSSGLPGASVAALEAWSNGTPRVFEQVIVLDDVARVPALEQLVDPSTMPLCSLASAPLRSAGEPLGVLIALGNQQHAFLPRDVEVLQSYAAQAAIALTNARRYEVEKTLAARDPLTGLLNHRSFHEAVEAEIRATRGSDYYSSLILIDLDEFKRVNDEDGHAGGDRLLRAAARALSEACRREDLAFRVGGDEFALLLPRLDEQAAAVVAQRVCSSIAALDSRTGATAGLTSMGPQGPGKDVLLARADERLYRAKRGERPHRDRGWSGRETPGADLAADVLVSALEAHDAGTAAHCRRVSELADRVAAGLDLDDREQATARRVGLLHDLGKLALPAVLLRKRGPLSAQEWRMMRSGPQRGADIVALTPHLAELAEAVRGVQERWDGGGYPRRLSGEAIPLAARIVAVCDAYDAMTSEQRYRRARTGAEAGAELVRCAGSQFDPSVVRAVLVELDRPHPSDDPIRV